MFEELSKVPDHDHGKRVVRCEFCSTLLVSVDGATQEELSGMECPSCKSKGFLYHRGLGSKVGCIREIHKDRLGVYPIARCTWCSQYLGLNEEHCRFYSDKESCSKSYEEYEGIYSHDCPRCNATGLVYVDDSDFGLCPECSGFGFVNNKVSPSTFKGVKVRAGVGQVGFVSVETLVTAQALQDYSVNDMRTQPMDYIDFLEGKQPEVDVFTHCPREVYYKLDMEEFDGVCPMNMEMAFDCPGCISYHDRLLCWKSYNIKNKHLLD